MTNKISTPAIRFKGFTDAWEQRKLGELGAVLGGNAWQSKDYVEDGSHLVVTIANVAGDVYINDNIGNHINISSDSPYLLKKDDILISMTGNVGRVSKMTDSNGVLNQRVGKFLLNNGKTDKEFLFTVMRSNRFEDAMVNSGQGAAQKNIKNNDILDYTCAIPTSKEEQAKIGKYFSRLDETITLHQRKLEKLQNIKKSMLEKMFPKNGSKYPAIRFKGFTDAWEQRKLSDIAGRYDNLRVPVAANLRIAGKTPYYGANGIQDYVDGYTHDGEFVLVAEDGANDLKNYPVKCVKGRIWVNNHAHVLQGKSGIADNQFLAYNLRQTDIESLLVGGGRAKLNAETMMGIEIKLPKFDEQIAIGSFFASLDNTITLHQRKLEKLQNIKKSMLEKMFV